MGIDADKIKKEMETERKENINSKTSKIRKVQPQD